VDRLVNADAARALLRCEALSTREHLEKSYFDEHLLLNWVETQTECDR
jgi:hypothetical protein